VHHTKRYESSSTTVHTFTLMGHPHPIHGRGLAPLQGLEVHTVCSAIDGHRLAVYGIDDCKGDDNGDDDSAISKRRGNVEDGGGRRTRTRTRRMIALLNDNDDRLPVR
jgi:hypothetical protein